LRERERRLGKSRVLGSQVPYVFYHNPDYPFEEELEDGIESNPPQSRGNYLLRPRFTSYD